jgi:hypothetical protein
MIATTVGEQMVPRIPAPAPVKSELEVQAVGHHIWQNGRPRERQCPAPTVEARTHPRPTPRRRRCSSSRHHQNCQRYRQTGGAQGVSFSGVEDVKTSSNHFGRNLSVGGVRTFSRRKKKNQPSTKTHSRLV